MMFITTGLLVEKRTGQSLKDFLRSRIWEPLNMTETYFSPVDAQAAGKAMAQGYYLELQNQFMDAGALRQIMFAGQETSFPPQP
ncbi:hypothetical protein BDV32DRAFT_132328, partial [Aspergillus pseudonomiae]